MAKKIEEYIREKMPRIYENGLTQQAYESGFKRGVIFVSEIMGEPVDVEKRNALQEYLEGCVERGSV